MMYNKYLDLSGKENNLDNEKKKKNWFQI